MTPKVSVITPTYNSEKYLKDCIQSVIQQTYKNWELIIVDDGSSDDTPFILKRLEQTDKRIKVLFRNRDPKGSSMCRNIGIKNSCGEYIIFLDSDDMLAPYCIENRIKLLKKNHYLDFAVFPTIIFKRTTKDTCKLFNKYFERNTEYLLMFLRNKYPWHTMCPIWTTEFLNKIGGFDEEMLRNTDPDLHTRALLEDQVKFEIFLNEKADCFYRINTLITDNNKLAEYAQGRVQYIKKINLVLNTKYQNKILSKTEKQIKKAFATGAIEFVRDWIVSGDQSFELNKFIFWAFENDIINLKNYILLKILNWLWIHDNVFFKLLKSKGFVYRLMR